MVFGARKIFLAFIWTPKRMSLGGRIWPTRALKGQSSRWDYAHTDRGLKVEVMKPKTAKKEKAWQSNSRLLAPSI
jgi:hypothetical protein